RSSHLCLTRVLPQRTALFPNPPAKRRNLQLQFRRPWPRWSVISGTLASARDLVRLLRRHRVAPVAGHVDLQLPPGAKIQDLMDEHGPLRIAMQHRVGDLAIGDIAVIVAVAAPHRDAAFAAARAAIDELKTIVPIWKKEHAEDGAIWIEEHA